MKRYSSTIELYVYANSEKEAYIKSVKKAIDINTDDNCACLTEMYEVPFGKMESIKIDIDKLKT